MLCNIINPSDPCTLRTDNFLAAAVAVALAGIGVWGLECEDPPERTPVLFGWEGWFHDKGIDDLGAWIDAPANRAAMIEALESVIIGTAQERATVEVALRAVDDPKAFLAEYHDRRRSSMNDIGAICARTVQGLRNRAAEAERKATGE